MLETYNWEELFLANRPWVPDAEKKFVPGCMVRYRDHNESFGIVISVSERHMVFYEGGETKTSVIIKNALVLWSSPPVWEYAKTWNKPTIVIQNQPTTSTTITVSHNAAIGPGTSYTYDLKKNTWVTKPI